MSVRSRTLHVTGRRVGKSFILMFEPTLPQGASALCFAGSILTDEAPREQPITMRKEVRVS